MKNHLSVRELLKEDISHICDYWLKSDDEYLVSLGVDLSKIPGEEFLTQMLQEHINAPYDQKQSYALIWCIDDKPIGHCNVNQIEFGKSAYMHLHIWKQEKRRKGIGAELLKLSLPYFFENLKINTIYCEPYALNPAPNKTLEKVGFIFEKEYVTIPGSLNFEQLVKRWKIDRN